MKLMINEKVPQFTGEATGGLFDLNALQGKNIVLYFYPKDNTPGCTIESKTFRDFYPQFKALNTEIIGISRDDMTSHHKFINSQQLNFPLISDVDGKICELFEVIKEKNMFGKKYKGIERSTFLIDKQGVLREVWRNVSVPNHVETVLKSCSKLI